MKPEASINDGRWEGPSQDFQHDSFSAVSPNSLENEDGDYANQETEMLDRRYLLVHTCVCVCVCVPSP